MPTILVLAFLLSPVLTTMLTPMSFAAGDTSALSSALRVSPDSAFQKESTAMTFRLPMKAAPRGLVLLVQTDQDGKIIREIGPMTDDGVMGDSEKGDLTYSRKIHVNEKKATTLYFGVIQAAKQNAGTAGKAEVFTSVEILDRPTFTELLSKVWGKVKAGL